MRGPAMIFLLAMVDGGLGAPADADSESTQLKAKNAQLEAKNAQLEAQLAVKEAQLAAKEKELAVPARHQMFATADPVWENCGDPSRALLRTFCLFACQNYWFCGNSTCRSPAKNRSRPRAAGAGSKIQTNCPRKGISEPVYGAWQ